MSPRHRMASLTCGYARERPAIPRRSQPVTTGALLPLDINHLHQLARPGDESGAVPARNQDLLPLQIRS